jgi:hypothetical protein
VFEDRVARALSSLGVPTKKEIDKLSKRVAELTAVVQKLTEAQEAAKPIAKVAAKTAPAAAKAAAPKAAPAKKPAAPKSAAAKKPEPAAPVAGATTAA